MLRCKKCKFGGFRANQNRPSDEPEQNDVSKNVELNCWIPCWASPFSEPFATARARWTPPKARSSRPTPPASRSRPHRAVPTSQRHGYQAEDVRHPLPPKKLSPPNSTAFLATPRRACSSRDRRAPLERPRRPPRIDPLRVSAHVSGRTLRPSPLRQDAASPFLIPVDNSN